MANPDFDTIASATLRNYRTKLIENVMGHQVLLWQLKERGFRGVEKGGTTITDPIMYGTNSTVQSYRGYDVLDVTPQGGFTTIELPWKYLSVAITISDQEEFENSGSKSKIFDLLEGKIKQAEISLKLVMNAQLFGDGTGNDGKDITGLELAVEDGAAWSTYGGIDRSTYAFWRPQYIDANGDVFGDANGPSTDGITHMRRMYNNTSRGNSKPSLIITTQDLYEAYEANTEDKLRLTDTKLADLGFVNQTYKKTPMIFDEDCPVETMYFLNSDFIKLVVGKGKDFTTSDFRRPHNQHAKVAHIQWAGNLLTSKSDQQGSIRDLHAA